MPTFLGRGWDDCWGVAWKKEKETSFSMKERERWGEGRRCRSCWIPATVIERLPLLTANTDAFLIQPVATQRREAASQILKHIVHKTLVESSWTIIQRKCASGIDTRLGFLASGPGGKNHRQIGCKMSSGYSLRYLTGQSQIISNRSFILGAFLYQVLVRVRQPLSFCSTGDLSPWRKDKMFRSISTGNAPEVFQRAGHKMRP